MTTYWPPILADRTVYRIILAANASPSAAQVRAVARVSGANFLHAKRALVEAPEPLFAGRAEAVLSVLATLEGAGVASTVQPTFRWTAVDAPETVRAAGLRPAPLNDPFIRTS